MTQGSLPFDDDVGMFVIGLENRMFHLTRRKTGTQDVHCHTVLRTLEQTCLPRRNECWAEARLPERLTRLTAVVRFPTAQSVPKTVMTGIPTSRISPLKQ